MCVYFSRALNEFTVDRVLHHALDSNNDRLVHLVANNTT
ncbi:Uncharacterised protein [Vibrio cholerae]|nr:Uncharacterised protein [Vibrio cholerae]